MSIHTDRQLRYLRNKLITTQENSFRIIHELERDFDLHADIADMDDSYNNIIERIDERLGV